MEQHKKWNDTLSQTVYHQWGVSFDIVYLEFCTRERIVLLSLSLLWTASLPFRALNPLSLYLPLPRFQCHLSNILEELGNHFIYRFRLWGTILCHFLFSTASSSSSCSCLVLLPLASCFHATFSSPAFHILFHRLF